MAVIERDLLVRYQHIFSFMKVTWGAHPNNLGHNDYAGWFRCHDGSHDTKATASITNDCSACHTLLTMDDPNPKLLTDRAMRVGN